MAWVERHRWLSVPVLTAHRFGSHHLPTFAAAISFQAIISLFPLLAAITAGASFFVDPAALTRQILEVTEFIAPQSAELLGGLIQSVTNLRSEIGLVSLLGLAWTGTALFGAFRRGLNAATGVRRRRRYVHGRLFDLGVGAAAGLMLALSLALTAGLAIVTQAEALGPDSPLASLGVLIRAAAVLTPLTLAAGIFVVLFRTVPAEPMAWRAALIGGALAAALFELGKNLFVWYAATFSSFNVVYGPISTVAALLVWLYYSSMIVLASAAFGTEFDRAARFHARRPGPGR